MFKYVTVALGLCVAGSAFALTTYSIDYSGFGGSTKREIQQLTSVDSQLEVVHECLRKTGCGGEGGGDMEQQGACMTLLGIAYGKGDCRRGDICLIEREHEYLEGGLFHAVRIVCSQGETIGGAVDDASAFCGTPSGHYNINGNVKSCVTHGDGETTQAGVDF